ncbi:amidase [Herbaspirillum seropedicae]|uniref:amidase n=1 Tax=Herbaspirillum seropedicae TaxID=964 RepID=UPI0011235701|nr:amidase family protein [Herbaspirillum seropedicae]QDD63199.1 amidase [Herbaspirillum seropedicae]
MKYHSNNTSSFARASSVVFTAMLLGAMTQTSFAQGKETASQRQLAQDPVFEASITHLQSAQDAGRVSSRSLVLAYLARIRAYDQQGPSLNAIVTLNPKALEEADQLDRERRQSGPRGPLHGIPILVKDNYDTMDMPTTGGTLALATLQAQADAFQVKRLREAGAVILGKTTMHELAAGVTTVSSLTGFTRNPYDPRRAPGGSSGGTGAAVAASFAAAGMGSDTCGSIRIPAAHQNLFGLRTTRGLASRSGVMPLSSTQDVAAPLARSVEDLAIMLDATVGSDPQDSSTVGANGHVPKSYRDGLRADSLQGARIGVLRALFGAAPEDAEVSAAINKALQQLKDQGAIVTDVTIPELDGLLSGSSIIPYEFKYDLGAYLQSHPGAPVGSLGDILARGMEHELLEAGLRLRNSVDLQDPKDKEELEKVMHKRSALKSLMTDVMQRNHLDTLVYPTIQRKAALLGEPQGGAMNCQLSATTGLPALALPVGFTEDGLPVSLELLAPEFAEPALLGLAYGWEQKIGPRRPPYSTPALVAGKAPGLRRIKPIVLEQPGNASVRVELAYDPVTARLDYQASARKVAAFDVISLALQRGEADKPGPVVANLLRQHQKSVKASIVLQGKDREALLAGKLYVDFYTRSAPLGAGRQPLVLAD